MGVAKAEMGLAPHFLKLKGIKMLINFNDIKSRINEEPKWYTPEGVPRYCNFSHEETGVYVKFAILVEIECQFCCKSFMVGKGYTRENVDAIIRHDEENYFNNLNKILKGYHYGDPPRHNCVGDTMSCICIRFVEVWEEKYETKKQKLGKGEKIVVAASIPKWIRRTDLENPCEYEVDNLQ